MKSLASAPGKVILFGEHFVVHGTSAILAAINNKVTVTSETIDEKKIIIKSNLGQIEVACDTSINQVRTSFKPFIYIANKMISKTKIEKGIQITIESEIPSGVGLGSSSACCVATAGSVGKLFSDLSKDEILELSIEAERTIFKETSGADSTICVQGGIIEYNKNSGFTKIEGVEDLQLLIANSGQTHSTNKVVNKVNTFKEENQEIFASLFEKESSLIANVRQALKNNDLDAIGKSMSENQTYLEQIGVSNEKLRSMISIANNTTFGSKITGAGGGGCIIALVDNSNAKNALKILEDNNFECFITKVDFTGLDTF